MSPDGSSVSCAIASFPVVGWQEFNGAAPALAPKVAACFSRHPHHVLGTVDSSGGPRLSGVNVFVNDGVMWFGCMPGSLKSADISRDPRVALHSAPLSETLEGGDARVTGTAHRLDPLRVHAWRPDTPSDGEFFEVSVERVHLVEVDGEELVVTMWDNPRGVRIVRRR